MRRARISMHGEEAGLLIEAVLGTSYVFEYLDGYSGPPVSLTMPVKGQRYEFGTFPPFFDGLLPEGAQLEALLRLRKLDRDDPFGQLMAVGQDMVGAVTAEEDR
jgi:serine/threonine-protein kinase HipA